MKPNASVKLMKFCLITLALILILLFVQNQYLTQRNKSLKQLDLKLKSGFAYLKTKHF